MNPIIEKELEEFDRLDDASWEDGTWNMGYDGYDRKRLKAFLSASLSRAINKKLEQLEVGLPKIEHKKTITLNHKKKYCAVCCQELILSQVKELINKNKI